MACGRLIPHRIFLPWAYPTFTAAYRRFESYSDKDKGTFFGRRSNNGRFDEKEDKHGYESIVLSSGVEGGQAGVAGVR